MVHLPNKPEADAQLMNDHPPFSISAPFYGFLQKEVETRINWESHTKPFAQKASVLPIRKKGVFLFNLTYNAKAFFCSR